MGYILTPTIPQFGDDFDKEAFVGDPLGLLFRLHTELDGSLDGLNLAPDAGISDGRLEDLITTPVTHPHNKELHFYDGTIPLSIYKKTGTDNYNEFTYCANSGVQLIAGWGPKVSGAIGKVFYVPFGVQKYVESVSPNATFFSPFPVGSKPTVVLGFVNEFGTEVGADYSANVFPRANLFEVDHKGFFIGLRGSVGGYEFRVVYLAMCTSGVNTVLSHETAFGHIDDWSTVVTYEHEEL